MKWSELLNCERPSRARFAENEELGLSPFERDYYSIVGCSYFRRLQNKTQVYTLDDNDFVRTRLTHSLEVSSIAEIIGRRVAKQIREKNLSQDIPDKFEENLSMVLRCAGLLHDLGNPPFGHSGEEYIRDYFQDNESRLRKNLTEQMWLDFINFEGNAHNVRIITKLGQSSNPEDNRYGMDLTNAVINSVVKYPCNSLEYNNREVNQDGKRKRGKIGYYYSEEWVLTRTNGVMSKTGTLVVAGENKRMLKNPIMLLMEAADDIAYATADIEDAIKKGKISVDSIKSVLPVDERTDINNGITSIQIKLRKIREESILDVINSFVENYGDIMEGNICSDFELIHTCRYKLGEMKGLLKSVFMERDRESEYYYNCKRNITECLNTLIEIINKNENERSLKECIVLDEMKQYIEKGKAEADSNKQALKLNNEEYARDLLYHNYLAVVDFVSGMTDSYVELFLNHIHSEEYYSIKTEETKKKIIEDLFTETDYSKAFVLMKKVGLVSDWNNVEKSIIMKQFLRNDAIHKAYNAERVISKLMEKFDFDRNSVLSQDEIEKIILYRSNEN